MTASCDLATGNCSRSLKTNGLRSIDWVILCYNFFQQLFGRKDHCDRKQGENSLQVVDLRSFISRGYTFLNAGCLLCAERGVWPIHKAS